MDKITYTIVIKSLNFNDLVDYNNVIADGFIPNTNVRWVLLATQQRLEFSLDNFVIEFKADRQAIVDAAPKQP